MNSKSISHFKKEQALYDYLIHEQRSKTSLIYTLVWMARIAEELKGKAIELGLEGPYTSWQHMFGWNTFGILLFGPAVATHSFFRTLNSIETELNRQSSLK